MKEVVLVTAYTPDEERLRLLINLIIFLTENNKDVILVTHSTNTPEYIIKKCKYYLYSSENKLIDSPEVRFFSNRYLSELFFGSKLVSGYRNTALAIYNMLYLGTSIAKNLGYEILHYVEYDLSLENLNLFNHTAGIIKSGYDVAYVSTGEEDLFGGFFTIDTKSFDFSELSYDENKLEEKLKKYLVVERMTKDYFFFGKKLYHIDYDYLAELGCNYTKYEHVKKDNPFVFPVFYQDYIQIVHDNQNISDEKLIVILNDNQIFTNCTNPGSFTLFPIGKIEEVKKITIMINDKIVKIYETDTPEKIDYIIQNSFVGKY